jgi:predicted nucleic acid-binding protein
MASSPKIPSQLKPLAEELLDNSYARENLQEGVAKLQDAYERSRKRRVKPSTDRKLRSQLEAAIHAIDEGTAALASGRHKPSHKGRNLMLGLLAAVAAGTAAVLATNEDLRNSVFGSAKALGDEITGADGNGDGNGDAV